MDGADISVPVRQRLVVAGPVRRIIGGFDLREPLHAGGMDLGDSALEEGSLDVFLDLAILELAFYGDELPLLERFGELREMAPGTDAMPLGAVLTVALVVLPAFLGCDAEDDILFGVLSGVLSGARCTQTDRSNRKGAGLFNGLFLMDGRSQKPAQGREEWSQLPHAGRYKGDAATNAQRLALSRSGDLALRVSAGSAFVVAAVRSSGTPYA